MKGELGCCSCDSRPRMKASVSAASSGPALCVLANERRWMSAATALHCAQAGVRYSVVNKHSNRTEGRLLHGPAMYASGRLGQNFNRGISLLLLSPVGLDICISSPDLWASRCQVKVSRVSDELGMSLRTPAVSLGQSRGCNCCAVWHSARLQCSFSWPWLCCASLCALHV